MAKRLYGHRWRKARETFLRRNPLCVFCSQQGKVQKADVVDHIKPHKGDVKVFWNTKNLQSLCFHCHNSIKQRMENGKEIKVIGEDGFPIDE